MLITPYELALIGGGFTVLGALIGALATYRFALQLQKIETKREAGKKLREAFSELLVYAENPDFKPDVSFGHELKEMFGIHAAAVNEYAFHLAPVEREKFEAAWHAYWKVDGSVRFYDYHMGENPKETLKSRVNDILQFTKT